ncbi:aldose 1-epimerase [Sporobacter termitidis DSM 10068]|uniref:Aldose 1-epimerase n=1 Tax=Sporobacter termitidis DSM 10068 TaxID=1123282 RepID=A0A1M5ZFP1_9FIRM|nr:aldose epimerase family protein [Sporobacter termitidis]SHI23030.1 aldose 1-epimerase [Sporobacter termitidis DSM 10068]
MTQFVFGRTKTGHTVTGYCLENSRGAEATILDYGCTVQSLRVPDAEGRLTDVVLGYDTIGEYEENGGYAGAAIGRVANRIGGAEFSLNGETYRLARNDGENHLHGGLKGFDKCIWSAVIKGDAHVFSRRSPAGEENYPGSLDVKITYTLTDDNALRITYDADTDADTIINLTNHSYFNLNGKGSVLGHSLQVLADRFLENDPYCLPTGKLLPAKGTPFDFGEPKQIGRDIDAACTQLTRCGGYDHNFVLSDPVEMKRAAVLHSAESGIRMTVLTTQPGLQVYSGNSLTPRKGKNGVSYGRRDAICLETQVFPNAMAHTHFPSPVLKKNEHYHTETCYQFEISDKQTC